MSMRVLWSIVLLAPLCVAGCPRAPSAVETGVTLQRGDALSEGDRQQLITITQRLLDAIAVGDTATWSRFLADGCLLTDADGTTRTKAQLLDVLQPLPAGYSGTLRLERPAVRGYGGAAVINYDAFQHEVIYGQSLTIHYRTTDTYVKTDGGWRMIASQAVVVPGDPTPVPVDSAVLGAYAGRYALAPDVVYEVTREGGRLFGQWPGQPREELIPAGPALFFQRGVRGVRLFVRDSAGRVTSMIERRDNNDLVLTRQDH